MSDIPYQPQQQIHYTPTHRTAHTVSKWERAKSILTDFVPGWFVVLSFFVGAPIILALVLKYGPWRKPVAAFFKMIANLFREDDK